MPYPVRGLAEAPGRLLPAAGSPRRRHEVGGPVGHGGREQMGIRGEGIAHAQAVTAFGPFAGSGRNAAHAHARIQMQHEAGCNVCLLYTSDAADE